MVSGASMALVGPEWKVRVSGRSADWRAPAHETLRQADDREIVETCLAGHHEAFGILVERHQRRIYQLCYRFTGTHEDASDLAQDVFVRAFRGLGGFRGQAAFTTWLYRIAVNVCLNRKASRPVETVQIDGREIVDDAEGHPVSALLREERARQVRAAIARLPPKQRATLILRVYHELPHDQIARIFGSSVGAVKANFFHALGNLKKLLTSE
jgi:RNA polymerase sigma-70 factor, ECF subfamily